MNRFLGTKSISLAGIVGFSLGLSSCLKPEEQDPDPQNTVGDTTEVVNSQQDLKALNSCLYISNATLSPGKVPVTTEEVDFRIDKDTILLRHGFTDRIHLQSADCYDEGISSVLLQVVGSDEYFTITPQEWVRDDSLFCFKTTLGFEFSLACEDEDLPPEFDIEILPINPSGDPMDKIKRTVIIPNLEAEVECMPGPLDTWVWKWTTVNGVFHSSPGVSEIFKFSVNGCCMEGESVDCIANGIPEEEWIPLAYDHHRTVNMEYLTFHEDGSMNGILSLVIQNIDPTNSRFCDNRPAYHYNAKDHQFWGEYSFDTQSKKLNFTHIESRMTMVDLGDLGTYPEYDMHYISTQAEYEMIGCNILVEKTNVEGGLALRYFERLSGGEEEDVLDQLWLD
ncbi:MAG: hypothetical protein WD431_23645 [Cyclobacteriaceae bacterium]